MKISANDPLSRLKGMLGKLDETAETGRTQRRDKPTVVAGSEARVDSNSDGVSLSPQARELRRLREAIEQSPDVRRELVEAVRSEIASGRYRVDGTKIADRLLAEAREFDAAVGSSERDS